MTITITSSAGRHEGPYLGRGAVDGQIQALILGRRNAADSLRSGYDWNRL